MSSANYWTLTYKATGVTATFSDWAIEGLTRDLVATAADVCRFRQRVSFDTDPSFAIGQTCVIKAGGSGYFYGRVIGIKRVGEPSEEFLEYTLAGPWWYLENLPFEMDWKVASNPSSSSSTLTTESRSRAILCQAINGSRITTGSQVAAVVDFVIAAGAPITKGTIYTGYNIPFAEVKDLTCAEVIRQLLRWSPDVVARFDYSQDPPVLNILSRSSGSTVSVAIGAAPVQAAEANPRYDLQVPGVSITFEQQNQLDSVSWVDTTVQSAGSDTFGTLKFTVELSGSARAYQRQYVGVQAIAAGSLSWWASKLPWLASATGMDGTGSPTISGGAVANGAASEIISGACPPWLSASASTTKVTAYVSYRLTDTSTGSHVVKYAQPIAVNVTSTSLSSGTFSRLVSEVEGEGVPSGCATGLYASLSTLQWEGRLRLVEDDLSLAFWPGQQLNLTGGRTEWTTMLAQVQMVSEDAEKGLTTVTFGPPEHLAPQDYVELLRMQRGRQASWRLQERQDGIARGLADVQGPTAAALENASQAESGTQRLVLAETSGGSTKQVTLDPSHISTAAGATAEIRLREVEGCVDGVAKRALVMMSAWYDPPAE